MKKLVTIETATSFDVGYKWGVDIKAPAGVKFPAKGDLVKLWTGVQGEDGVFRDLFIFTPCESGTWIAVEHCAAVPIKSCQIAYECNLGNNEIITILTGTAGMKYSTGGDYWRADETIHTINADGVESCETIPYEER